MKTVAYTYLPAWPSETFPVIRIFAELPNEEYLDATLQEIAGRRIVGAQSLRLGAATFAIEAGRKHAGIVEDQEIVGTQQIGKIPKVQVRKLPGLPVEVNHARGGTVEQRFLCDLRFGKVVMKVGDQHAGLIIGCEENVLGGSGR